MSQKAPTTKGIQTSEFALTIISAIVMALNEKFDLGIPVESLVVVITYIVSRLGVKVATIIKQPSSFDERKKEGG